jgi:hypothetical protein
VTQTVLFGPGVLWWDVQLCHDADANNAITIDGSGSTFTHVLVVFNDSGNEVGQATGTDVAGSEASIPFGGTDPALPAGHYYIAMTFYDTDDPTDWDLAPTPTTAGRWHFRGRSGSGGFTIAPTVTVPWNFCPGQCCRADYNGDGDIGTDADIEAFFACLAGNCCPKCPPNADFNCDGDIGTDADIESFFRVLAGNAC